MNLTRLEIFKNNLSAVVDELSLNESRWGSKGWKIWETSPITQEILEDAFNQHNLIGRVFQAVGPLLPRPCKNLSRVEKKITEQRVGRENYFKVLSDFVAVRIHCELSEIQEKIDRIRTLVLDKRGQFYIRGASDTCPYGSFWDGKKYKDITQYVYVYLKEIGYPIEFQIGHPFATHTFTIDSALRDNRECGKVDLWTDGFYQDVKAYILGKANKEEVVSKEVIQRKAHQIHSGDVPVDLQQILNGILFPSGDFSFIQDQNTREALGNAFSKIEQKNLWHKIPAKITPESLTNLMEKDKEFYDQVLKVIEQENGHSNNSLRMTIKEICQLYHMGWAAYCRACMAAQEWAYPVL